MKTINLYVTRGLLLASGLLAAGIAATIFVVPDAFYASYGIEIGRDVNLANEMKAPAGLLFLAGLAMLAGVFRAEHAVSSLTVAAVVFLSYGLSRSLSMALDGIPNAALAGAAAFEIAIGIVCLIDLLRIRRSGQARRMVRRGAWQTDDAEVAA